MDTLEAALSLWWQGRETLPKVWCKARKMLKLGEGMAKRDQMVNRINFALNGSKRCVGCKYLLDCTWLKESGSWCSGKTVEVAMIIYEAIRGENAETDTR
jgi:hypothetical protein